MRKTLLPPALRVIIYFITLFFLFLTNSCRKSSTVIETPAENAAEVFYQNTEHLNPALKKLVHNFKKQHGLNQNLSAFIQKNGVPVWDKTLYKVKNKKGSSGNTQNIRTNSTQANSGNTEEVSDSENGLYLVPLTSTDKSHVQSYIAVSQNGDSAYSYRLYNKDSLNAIVPKNDSAKKELLNTMSVFGVFEKTINGRNEIQVIAGKKGIIRNASLQFVEKDDTKATQNTNSVQTLGKCYDLLFVQLSYEYLEIGEDYLYYESATISALVIVEYDCGATGNQQAIGHLGDDTPDGPYGSIPPSAGYNYYSGDWWRFGTGWPWSDPNLYGIYFPWSPWYSSSGGQADDSYILTPDDIAILDELKQEKEEAEAFANTPSPCRGVKRIPGSFLIQPQATVAHLLIQETYIEAEPFGVAEYFIPGSGANGGPGYADLVNILRGEIFEIKPISLVPQGATEAARYVTTARTSCPQPSLFSQWELGTQFVDMTFPDPLNPTQILYATLAQPGVISYEYRPRATNPLPVLMPTSVPQIVNELMKRRRRNPGLDFPEMALGYLKKLKDTPEGRDLLKDFKTTIHVTAYGLLVAYIAQGIWTEGVGLFTQTQLVYAAKDLICIAKRL